MDSLPDGVIIHILSFLPIKESASTSVLSERWRNLFTFSPNLELDYHNGQGSFVDFTDRLLSMSEHSLKNIILRFQDQAHISRWTHDVLNRGDLEFELVATTKNSLPFKVFTCTTLVKLNLTRISVNKLPDDAFLPALKTLVLNSVQFRGFQDCAFDKLLSACPVLEDLNIRNLKWEEWKWHRVLSSPSQLQMASRARKWPRVLEMGRTEMRLTIGYSGLFCFDGSDFEAIVFDTPKMFYFFREAIPVFKNLFHLSITPLFGYSWRGLPYLLNNSPNLHTLNIKGPLDSGWEYGPSGYSCLRLYPVRVIKITEYSGITGDMRLLKQLLGTLSCLELLEINVSGTSEDWKFKIATDLLMLPRASSKCKIKIK